METRPILIKPDTTIKITVGVAAATVKLPTGGGRQMLLTSRGSDDIAFNFGASNVTVAMPTATQGGSIVPPGASFSVTIPEGATHIATISPSAAQTFYVTSGDGA